MADRQQHPQVGSKSRTLGRTDDELKSGFEQLKTRRDLALLLDVAYWHFDWLVRRSPTAARYTTAEIKKRRGGTRSLLIPRTALKVLQRKLLQVLSAVFTPKTCVHGFVSKRSILSNAKPHVRRTWVLNVDIKDFFPSINFGRVRGAFMARPCFRNAEVATALAQICCHDNQLPQGAPTSPIVANLVCSRLDGAAIHLAKTNRLTYTRFADDLTFSTNLPKFPASIAAAGGAGTDTLIGPEMEKLLSQEGFTANASKVRLQNARSKLEVTGLTVNRFPNTSRNYVRQIRAMLHAWEKFGIAAAEREFRAKWDRKHRRSDANVSYMRVVRGKLEFLRMVRGTGDPIVESLWRRYATLDPDCEPREITSWHEQVAAAMWVLECEESTTQGTAVAIKGLGLLTCEHTLGSATHAFRRDALLARTAIKNRMSSKELDLALIEVPGHSEGGLELNLDYLPSIGDDLRIAGFPNYQMADTGHFLFQRVAGIRKVASRPRVLVDGPIAAGMSGGPVLDDKCRVVGIIVSGAEQLSNSHLTERHGFIPAEVLAEFLRQVSPTGEKVS